MLLSCCLNEETEAQIFQVNCTRLNIRREIFKPRFSEVQDDILLIPMLNSWWGGEAVWGGECFWYAAARFRTLRIFFSFCIFLVLGLKLHKNINDYQLPSGSWVTFKWALKWQSGWLHLRLTKLPRNL